MESNGLVLATLMPLALPVRQTAQPQEISTLSTASSLLPMAIAPGALSRYMVYSPATQ
jgi:hypothetical protein